MESKESIRNQKLPPPLRLSRPIRSKLERVAKAKDWKYGVTINRALDALIRHDPELGGAERTVEYPLMPSIDELTLGVN